MIIHSPATQNNFITKDIATKEISHLSNNFYKLAREARQEQKLKSKAQFVKHVPIKQSQYKTSDKVYVGESQIKDKLQNQFSGLSKFQEIIVEKSAKLVNWKPRQKSKVNFERL